MKNGIIFDIIIQLARSCPTAMTTAHRHASGDYIPEKQAHYEKSPYYPIEHR